MDRIQAQRVLHSSQELDMRAVDLARAVTNPQQMGRNVVPVPVAASIRVNACS